MTYPGSYNDLNAGTPIRDLDQSDYEQSGADDADDSAEYQGASLASLPPVDSEAFRNRDYSGAVSSVYPAIWYTVTVTTSEAPILCLEHWTVAPDDLELEIRTRLADPETIRLEVSFRPE